METNKDLLDRKVATILYIITTATNDLKELILWVEKP